MAATPLISAAPVWYAAIALGSNDRMNGVVIALAISILASLIGGPICAGVVAARANSPRKGTLVGLAVLLTMLSIGVSLAGGWFADVRYENYRERAARTY